LLRSCDAATRVPVVTRRRSNHLAAQRPRRDRLPAIYGARNYGEIGGLMCYGPDIPGLFRRAADFIDKILRGAKPADIPVEEPTRLLLFVNLTTAKALGLAVPQSILLRADEVIE